MNVKTNQIYSDSLSLSVVDLSRIDLATKEDKQYHIDDWAQLFKATTWEEIKMLADKNEYLNETAENILKLSADYFVRKRCHDREEYYQDLRNYERAIVERDNTIANYKKVLAEKDAENQKLLAEKDAENKRLLIEIEQLKQEK